MSNSTVQSIARKQGEKLADYIPRLGTTTLEFQPGSRWAYSAQAGHDTLGRIVEIASGMPLNEFFQKRIFDPLGMKDITFWPSEAQWTRVAERLHRRYQRSHEEHQPQRHVEQRVLHGLRRTDQHR